MAELLTLNKIPPNEFKKANKDGIKVVSAGLVLVFFKNLQITNHSANIGFIATRKIGNAVKRNKAKRRLKSLSREIMPKMAQPGFSYVMICRQACIKRTFESLKKDLRYCLHQVKQHTKNETISNFRNQNL